MNQLDFLKLFSTNIKKIQYSASDDLKGKKGHTERKFKPHVEQDEIESLNDKGYGIYFTVNKFPKGSRIKSQCLRVRAVWVEDDDTGELVKDWPLPPSIIVNSSEGKYHYYWLTSTKKYNEFELVMQTMVDKYNCDKKARDISRVMRLPETYHHKSKKRKVEIVGGSFKKYKWEVIKTAFPPAKKKKSNYSKSEDGEFDMLSAIQALTSTDDLHGSMISIALSCVNRGMDKSLFINAMMGLNQLINYDAIDFHRAKDVQSRFSEIHLDECFDSAVEKVKGEIQTAKAIQVQKSKDPKLLAPEFPEDCIKSWPDPWPLMWEEFKKLPRTLEPALLLPTMLSVNSYILNANFVTEFDRRPNMAFLGIAMSTANKDVNSKNVIRSLDSIMRNNGIKHSPFTAMMNSHESVTSDTAFLESFSNGENFFWVNTEATHLFQQLSQGGTSNAHVKALESKIINVVDGQEIMGKMKAGKQVKTIQDPNCQILLYTQPETISSYLQNNIIDSGLLGRMIITVHQSKSDPFEHVFKHADKAHTELHEDLIHFYAHSPAKSQEKRKLKYTKRSRHKMIEWMKTDIKDKAGNEDNKIKMLKRLEITADQLYTLILGISKLWYEQHDGEIKSFDASAMIPLLNYWADCKLYAINEYVNTQIDPLAEAIRQAFIDLISGEKKVQKGYQKVLDNYHAVPISEIVRVLSSQKKLLRTLTANYDTKNFRERVSRMIFTLSKDGDLIEVEIPNKRTKFYGFPNEFH